MQEITKLVSKICFCYEYNVSLLSHPVVPDVEVKGESAHYFLLVQGSDDIQTCQVRMLHSDSQINGAAAMATVSGLLREKSLPSSGILFCQLHRGVCFCACLSVCGAATVNVLRCHFDFLLNARLS